MSEGFYFRHDSIKNPQFDKNQAKLEQHDRSNQKAKDQIMSSNIEKMVLDKI